MDDLHGDVMRMSRLHRFCPPWTPQRARNVVLSVASICGQILTEQENKVKLESSCQATGATSPASEVQSRRPPRWTQRLRLGSGYRS
eukprot:1151461-Pelagomonas_calceolata.AAC.2